jgi:hypothetical protein
MPKSFDEQEKEQPEDEKGRQAGSGRGLHGQEDQELHHAHNEHTQEHRDKRRSSDSRR